MSATHPCAACGFKVFAAAPGSGGACPVCGWIDDFEQLVHPDLAYGANSGRTLRQAQSEAVAAHPPGEAIHGAFERDARWRPLRGGETPQPAPNSPSSPVCYIATPDPADYVPYWLRAGRA